MMEFFRKLFTTDFMPHGHCYLWQPGILWLHVISDGLITVAYYSIPLSLLYFVRKRRDIAFEWMFVMFGVFICACGTTHLLEIVTVWEPVYRFAGLVKAITAFASVSTALLLWRLMPRMLQLPSPTQLRESNRLLEREVSARREVEEALRQSRDDLEERVRARTAELAQTNAELRVEIDRRHQAQEETRTNQEQFQRIIDHAPTPIFIKDRAGRYLLANEAFATICGVPVPELLGHTISQLLPVLDVASSDAHSERVFASGVAQEFEETVARGDETRHFLSLRFPLPGPDETLDTLGVISRDVTERKLAEEAIKQARHEAERANAAKSEFLSRMSHELRTPMNAILGFAQLLEADRPTPRQADATAHILKGGRHLLTLINEVLDLARVESGHMSLSPEPVSATTVFEESLDLVRPMANQRGLSLQVHFGPARETWVRADRQRLKQVLVNFLSNAVKFNREHGSITVSCQAVSDERVRCCVRDTGCGIAPEDQTRLFSAFERLSADRAGVEGTGLGLALAKRLTELMGGTVSVESVLGEGTALCLELPRTHAPESSHPDGQMPSGINAPAEPHDRTLLYVEDNLSNLALVERILEDRPGIRLIHALRGDLGLSLAREHRPEVILLDLDLPDLHGREVLRTLRTDPLSRNTPVVIISANALPRSVENLLRAGANAYLTKPIDVREFLRVLDEQFAALGRGLTAQNGSEDR